MKLYFLRHGKAEDRQPGRSDADRKLTSDGIQEMEQEARGLAALEMRWDAVYSSPYPRALETAQIAAEGVGFPRQDIMVDPRLAAGSFGLGNLQALLFDQPASASILLVGHEPDFSEVVCHLCGGIIELKKGGLAYVETGRLEPGYGVLRWLLTPKHLMDQE